MKNKAFFVRKQSEAVAELVKIDTDSLERVILASVLFFSDTKKKSFIYDVLLKLSNELFDVPANRELYSAIMNVHSKHFAVSETLVANELQSGAYSIGPDFLVECNEDFANSNFSNPKAFLAGIDDLIEMTKKRNFAFMLSNAIVDLQSGSSFDLTYSSVMSKFFSFGEENSRVSQMPDVYKGSGLWLNEEMEGKGGDIVPTGFKSLDKIIDGFSPGSMYVIGARPRVGKSSLGLNFFHNIALSNGGVMFLSLEMTQNDIYYRLHSRKLGISSRELQTRIRNLKNAYGDDAAEKNLDTDIFNKLTQEFTQYRNKNAYIYAESSMGLNSVYSHNIANVMQYAAKTRGVKVFIIDYLQLIKDRSGEKYRNRNLEIANITGIIKSVAHNLGVSVIVLSQLSRTTTIGGGRPTLASLRDSGAIEQDADVVMLLHRDVDADTNKLSDIANLEVAKNRFGISDTVTLYFNGTETTFYENAQDPFLDIRY